MRLAFRLGSAAFLAVLTLLTSIVAPAQSTQSLIQGRVLDSISGQPLTDAEVVVSSPNTQISTKVRVDVGGRFHIPLLSPGLYRVRVEAPEYQAQQIDELPLPVGSLLDRNFLLRPLRDVWERGGSKSVFVSPDAILPYFGPDAEPGLTLRLKVDLGEIRAIETGMSYSIDPVQLKNLPLAGRDAYALLVTVPGVASDAANGRGLGLSVSGQRPTSSNFLLDGLENNNYLIAGPLVTMAPEAIQEYRVTTNNFAAEYGGTSGFIANTVSIPGGPQWHGLGYLYARNDALNGNEFQRNVAGFPRRELVEWQPGASLGGPIRKNRLFASAAVEYLHYRSADDETTISLPPAEFNPTGAFASSVWKEFAAGKVASGTIAAAPPANLTRLLVLPRVDYLFKSGTHRLLFSAPFSKVNRPDFFWSPYPDFSSPLTQPSFGPRVNYLASLRPDMTLEARASFAGDTLRFDRAHPEIPTLTTDNGVYLPGSHAFYSFKNRTRSQEALANLVWTPARNVLKWGGGALFRSSAGYLTAGQDGTYYYANLAGFASDSPVRIRVAIDRLSMNETYVLPNYSRDYRSRGAYFFAQDSFRMSRRLTLNGGLRVDYLGIPRIGDDSQETLIALAPGTSWEDRFEGAALVAGRAGQPLFQGGQWHISPRLGFALALTKSGRTLLRGSWGAFYDRPYDNLWQNVRNNAFVLSSKTISFVPQRDVEGLLDNLGALTPDLTFSRLTLFADRIDAARAYNSTLSLEHQLSTAATLEVAYLGSLGRNLLVTDQVNRPTRLGASGEVLRFAAFRSDWPRVWYKSSDGSSDYHALATSVRLRAREWQGRVSYTWSHAQDIQSEPLRGDFFDLGFTRAGVSSSVASDATFSQQFEPAAERANAEFDQRHNFSYWGSWQPYARRLLLRDWTLSILGSVRSGFPYTVFQPPGFGTVDNRRADLIQANPSGSGDGREGGVQLLNVAAFQASPPNRQGTSGRNAFRAPSYSSLDFSVARRFPLRWLGEAGYVVFRADAFNLLNHANLDAPDNVLGDINFGIASYGRRGQPSVFPALTPFTETPRQIQLMLRVQF